MNHLGAPWEQYFQSAMNHKISVLRYPIVEGKAPLEMKDFHQLIVQIENNIENGISVNFHCRGGIGRAGLILACTLLKMNLVKTPQRSIIVARKRRSAKAIETQEQENFIHKYHEFLQQQ